MKRTMAAIAAALMLGAAGCGGSDPETMATPAPGAPSSATQFQLRGSVAVKDEVFEVTNTEYNFCSLSAGYQDLAADAPVTVTDEAGKVVALGALQYGVAQEVFKHSDGKSYSSSCLFKFSFAVPEGGSFYGVEVSRRGVVRYDRTTLDSVVSLSLGS